MNLCGALAKSGRRQNLAFACQPLREGLNETAWCVVDALTATVSRVVGAWFHSTRGSRRSARAKTATAYNELETTSTLCCIPEGVGELSRPSAYVGYWCGRSRRVWEARPARNVVEQLGDLPRLDSAFVVKGKALCGSENDLFVILRDG